MRRDSDTRTEQEREIDDFLSQFDDQDDGVTTSDVDSYLKSEPNSSHRNKEAKNSAEKKESFFARLRNKRAKSEKGSKGSLKERLFMKKNPNYDPNLGETVMIKGKKVKNKPMKLSIGKVIRNLVVLFASFCVMFFIYAFIVISMAPKIDPENIYDSVAQSSVVYDDSGKEIDTVYYSQDRQIIGYKEMPKELVNAFVALEDKTFWEHHGFNWTRMIGAVLQSFTGSGHISGTSTITQQLARNVYLPNIKSQRSIKRKILEMYYASQIERNLPKEKIVEAYLNTIYLGFGSYGVYSASHAYFSKDPKDLTLEECTALASLPQAPDSYALVKLADSENVSQGDTNIIMRSPDTYIANDIAKNRRNTCLNLMLDQGYISKKQHKAAYDRNLIDFINPTVGSGANVNSYFSEYMLDQVAHDLMKKYDITYAEAERMIYTGGLRIHSTLDSTAQSVIVEEFNNASNFPTLVSVRKDGSGNIIDASGGIMLYEYGDSFDSEGNFSVPSSECTVSKDGSVTLLKNKRLNIYTTKSGGKTDYSLEFKKLYVQESGTIYIYSGGYINVPSNYKSLDKDGNLVIDKKYFKDHPEAMAVSGGGLTIHPAAYSLNQKTIQPQGAMVIVEVGSGQVKAMVGGRGQSGRRLYNRALHERQPGSSIKPLAVYGAALQKSYELAEAGQTWPFVDYKHDKQGVKHFGSYMTASSIIVDEPMTFNGKTWPKNAGGGYSGAVTMRRGIQQSINTVAVKIHLQVGNEYSADLLEKFGITTLDREGDVSDMNSAALALGGLTNGVIPLEMAQAYATFPNGGVRQSSVAYTKVTDRNGKTILKSKSKQKKVLNEGVAFIMTDMLKSVVTNGIAGAASVSKVQSGGKTGTTNSNYDIWFDGFTPTYAAALWIGTDVNIKLSTMSGTAARLWGRIMNRIPNALKGSYKSQPANVIRSGSEYYTKGTEKGKSTYVEEKQQEAAEEAAETETETTDEGGGTAPVVPGEQGEENNE